MNEVITLKQIAESFLKMAASGSVDQAYTKYVDAKFIHHNQHYKGDRESLKLAMEESIIKSSGMKLDVKTMMEDGDRVITYSQIRANSSDMEIAAFHMFKFKGDKIIEMWDVGQVVSKDSPNVHGMF
jgi:predicted SnoaL-like aldol condensation-catalyzing enzyme